MGRLLVLLASVIALFAQGPGPGDKDPRAIIEKVRIYRLTEELDLSTDQAVKFFPKMNELRKLEDDFQKARMDMIQKLEEQIRDKASDKDIIQTLNDFEDATRVKWEKDQKIRTEIKALLTPWQQAKLLIFQDKFEREIRDMIREIRDRRPPKD
jgi:Spy/CpxP family protein refolding chaperone